MAYNRLGTFLLIANLFSSPSSSSLTSLPFLFYPFTAVNVLCTFVQLKIYCAAPLIGRVVLLLSLFHPKQQATIQTVDLSFFYFKNIIRKLFKDAS